MERGGEKSPPAGRSGLGQPSSSAVRPGTPARGSERPGPFGAGSPIEVPRPALGARAPRKESPFKTKGNLYQGTIAFFQHNCPGGFAALVQAAEDPHLREFLSQSFLTGGMYEVMLVPELIELEARVMRLELGKYLDKRTRWQADRDIGGVYRMLLKLASPETVAARLPKVMTQTFNFGRPTTVEVGPRHFSTEMAGVPAPLRYWLETCIAIYVETALAMAGAKNPMVRVLPSKPEAPLQGYPLVTLRFDARWDV